jgi:DNA-binding SARP family transcriptional activator
LSLFVRIASPLSTTTPSSGPAGPVPVASTLPPDAGTVPDVTRFSLLGPVEARQRAVPLDLGTPQQRALFALLLLSDGQPLSVERAVRRLWGEDPPRSAEGTLRTYVYRLRRVLAQAGSTATIAFTPAGYVLDASASALDVNDFRRLTVAGREREAEGDLTSARLALREALALWRGVPLSGVDAPGLEEDRRLLEERKLEAQEVLMGIELRLGDDSELLPELRQLVAAHPLHEPFRELLMLALHRAGHHAKALESYEDGRRALDAALGVPPGAALRELHGRIVQDDPSLPSAATPAAAAPPWRRPAQLPPDLDDFVGRADEISALTEALRAPGAVVGLTGLDGMGKTSLAVRVARLLDDRFPGGQLYADLRGRDPLPADPSVVLASLLWGAGVPAGEIPEDVDERAALWRTAMCEQQAVLLLDDVAAAAQLRPLLPGGPGVATIITSRRRIVDAPGVRWFRIAPLHDDEGIELMTRVVGADRVGSDPGSARRLVAACSGQPLAVRLAAARLADRPHWSLPQIEQQLYDDLEQPVVMHEDCRLVDAPIARAEAGLTPQARRALHLLSLPERDAVDVELAVLVLGAGATAAHGQLEELVDAGLLTADPDGRYRFMTLTQAWARRRARAAQPAAAVAAAERLR